MLPIKNLYVLVTTHQNIVIFEKNAQTVKKLAWGAVPPFVSCWLQETKYQNDYIFCFVSKSHFQAM